MHEVSNMPWFTIFAVVVFVAVPIFLGLLYLVCGWVDDWEESFVYPSASMIPYSVKEYDGSYRPLSAFIAMLAVIVSVAADALRVNVPQFFWPFLFASLSIALLLYVVKKGVRLKKAFFKHIADKNAHR